MSNYKCIRSFKTSKGKHYYYGDNISSSEYQNLKPAERNNFQQIYEDDSRISSGSGYSITGSDFYSPSDYGSSSSSWDTSSDGSSSSDSSGFDFGGGDGGGAGSSGDW